MKWTLERTLCAAVCMAALSACSQGSGSGFAPPAPAGPERKTQQTQTFSYTGGEQSFVVPPGVNSLTITADGAAGESSGSGSAGGNGGLVKATVAVTPGETLAIFVG